MCPFTPIISSKCGQGGNDTKRICLLCPAQELHFWSINSHLSQFSCSPLKTYENFDQLELLGGLSSARETE